MSLNSDCFLYLFCHQNAPYDQLWPYHAISVFVSFTLLFAAMLTARLFKRRKWWLKAHRALGVFGAILALLGASFAFYMVSVTTGEHLAAPHSYLGSFTVLLLLLTPALGVSQIHFKSRSAQLRRMHRFSGRALLTLMALNIIAGMRMVELI